MNLNELIKSHSYNAVIPLFQDENLNASDLLNLYKKHNKRAPRLFDEPEFWQSELPLLYLKEVLESEQKSTFLHKYFSVNKHANDALITCLFLNFRKEFLRYFKLNRTFLLPDFRVSLQRISSVIPELQRLSDESRILSEEWEDIHRKQEQDDRFLVELTLDEILMGLVLFYQEVKYSPQMMGNKAGQFEVENVLLELVQHALILKKQKNAGDFSGFSNERLQQEFARYVVPHPILGKTGLDTPLPKVYSLVFDIAQRFITTTTRKNQIELYQCGFADIESTLLNPVPLNANEAFDRFRKNDYKKGMEEFYFQGVTSENLNDSMDSGISIKSSLGMFEFYGIPKLITLNDCEVDLGKALWLLQHFSAYKGPSERTIFPDKTFVMNNSGDEQFQKCFGKNESISVFDFQHLKSGIVQYFNWSEKESADLIRFLTLDLSDESNQLPECWFQRPFLKIDNQIIWLGTFLKDRHWSNILLNKLKHEDTPTDQLDCIAKNLEKNLEMIFQQAGFRTVQGLKYGIEKGKARGDLDVVAFKDDYLLICEVKSGERSHDFSYAICRETVKLEEKAGRQLKRAIDNKTVYWNELQDKLGIRLNPDNIKIVPLLVTDTFEGDQRSYYYDIRKTTLLELDVILRNNKRELCEMYLFHQRIANSGRNEHRNDIVWDLWEGLDYLTVDRLLMILDNGLGWSND